MIDFTLPQVWLDPKNKEHVLLVANRIAAIRYGDEHLKSPPGIAANGRVLIFPHTNNHWLFPPTMDIGQPKGHWRLAARYDSDEELEMILNILKRFS